MVGSPAGEVVSGPVGPAGGRSRHRSGPRSERRRTRDFRPLLAAALAVSLVAGLVAPLPSRAQEPGSGGGGGGGGGADPMREVPNACQVPDQLTNITGSFGQTMSELTLPGLGGGLSFTRSYNSPDTRTDGPLGPGWSHAYDTRLKPGAAGASQLVRPSGRNTSFAPQADGSFQSPRGTFDVLTKAQDGHTLKEKDGTEWKFDAEGRLQSRTDSNGQATRLTYAGGKLQSVAEPSGREHRLSYDGGGRLSAVADPAGRTTGYSYTSTGRLQSVRQPGGLVWSYSYDADGRVNQVLDPDGHVESRTSYDAKGRINTYEDASANRSQISYDEGPDGQVRTKTTTDATGQKVIDEFNEHGEVVARTAVGPDGLSRTLRFSYDPRGNCASVTDALGRTTSFTYDDRGNVLTRTDPLGQTASGKYDARNNLIERVDTRGGVARYTYDERNNMVRAEQQLEPGGTSMAVTTNTYDARGLMTSVTDSNGHTTALTYDAAGNASSTRDPLGQTTTFVHDTLSRLTSVSDPRGARMTMAYDDAGRVARSTTDEGGLNAIEQFEYDGRGNQTAVRDANGNRRTFEFDSASRLRSAVDPLGRRTGFEYDQRGNQVRQVDPSGQAWISTYDGLDRMVKSTDPLGLSEHFTYDLMDNLLSSKDKAGRLTSFTYDTLNRVKEMTDPAGGKARFGYDPANNVTALTDPLNHTTSFTYNLMGWLRTETDPLGNRWERSYDNVGNLTSRRDAKGQTTGFSYDASDQPTRIAYADGKTVSYSYDPGGNRVAMADSTGTTTATYDGLNRVTKVDQPQVGAVSYGYDRVGNRTSLGLPGGRTTIMGYDIANQLVGVTDGTGRASRYEYDARGLPTKVALPHGIERRNTYDAAGRLLGIEHWRADTKLSGSRYTLDSVANRTAASESFACGNAQINRDVGYQYDSLDRVVGATYSDGSPAEAHAYDAAGNRTSAKYGQHTTAYEYDAANRLVRAAGPQEVVGASATATVCVGGAVVQADASLDALVRGEQAFRYDANGNLLEDGKATYEWDAADQLVRSTRPSILGPLVGPDTSTFTYNGDGVRVASEAGGKTTRYLEDIVADLPVVLRETTTSLLQNRQVDYTWGNELLSQFEENGRGWQALLPDGLGSIRAMVNEPGQVTDSFKYDAFGNDQKPNPQRPTSFGFAGEQVDTDTGLTYLRARYYDPKTGRFTARDDLVQGGPGTQGFNRYAYANNNPVNWTDPSGHLLDTIADVASIGYDTYRLVKDGKKNRKENLAALGADAAGALIPFGTGFGAGVRAASKGDEALKAVKMGKKLPKSKIKSAPKKRGNAPIGNDGKPVELHHRNQNPDGPLDQMTRTDHRGKGNYKKNHADTKSPSKIDRKEFGKQRRKIWSEAWDKGDFKK